MVVRSIARSPLALAAAVHVAVAAPSKPRRYFSTLHSRFLCNPLIRFLDSNGTVAGTSFSLYLKGVRLRHPRNQRRMVQGVRVVDGQIVNLNPATGGEIGRVPCSTANEVAQMMERAQLAQKTVWGTTKTAKERIRLIQNGLDELWRHSDRIASLIVQEMGKPIAEAREEMAGVRSKDVHLQMMEELSRPVCHGRSNVVVRQPLGVVVVLSPWNFPCDEILLLTLPALVAGNAVVVKPSEVTPETGAFVVQTLAAALPPGVLQLAQGDGRVGAMLVQHAIPAMIAMTGSSHTGQAILASAAADLKRFVLELGGKDPMVVFADCLDIHQAAKDAVEFSLSNTGQVCCSIERIYVAEAIFDEFAAAVVQEASIYIVGNGMDATVNVGPLVSTMQRDAVQNQVDDALQKGAQLLYQSEIPSCGGSFFPVTVLAQVNDSMNIYLDETFGPVVCLLPFDGSEEEAVRLANDSDYGLASSVYTADLEKAGRVASRIDAGQVGVNCYAIVNMHEACPWVGCKNSGVGFHSGREGFFNFSLPKTIVYSGDAPNLTTEVEP